MSVSLKRKRTPRSLESLRSEFHPTLNGGAFDLLTRGSKQKVWWLCKVKCCRTTHEWEATVNDRTQKSSGCPFCSRASDKTCLCKSLGGAFPHVANELVDKALDTMSIAAGSSRKLQWRCQERCCETDHTWITSVNHRTSSRSGCPFCSARLTCRCRSLAVTFPSVALQLVNVDPYAISPSSNMKLTWRCNNKCCKTDHVWESTVANRTTGGTGCPFCEGRPTCICKSLGSVFPEIAAELVDKSINVFALSPISGQTFVFSCASCGRKWDTRLSTRTGPQRSGCPFCRANKAESRLLTILDSLACVDEHWKRALLCFDVYAERYRMLTPDACGRTSSGRLFAIELDGPQHFQSVDYFGSGPTDLNDQMRRDLAKNRTLWRCGYSLLRVSFEEYKTMDDIIRQFVMDVDVSDKQILRTSNDSRYRDLQRRSRDVLEPVHRVR